ncbi:MAG: hypothetical protein WA724_09730 [Candidatus Dormiibacterota bacterium]
MVSADRENRDWLQAQIQAAQGNPFRSTIPEMELSQPKLSPKLADFASWANLLTCDSLSDANFNAIVARAAGYDIAHQTRSYWPTDDQIPPEERVTLLTIHTLGRMKDREARPVGEAGLLAQRSAAR